MKKIKTSAQTTNTTSTTITINNSGKILASTDLNTPTSMNFPEDERVKKILNLKKEKIYLDENVYVLAKGKTINICLQKGNKEEVFFSATLSVWNNDRTELIYEIIRKKSKPIENLLKNRF
jgi:hypothetical protein